MTVITPLGSFMIIAFLVLGTVAAIVSAGVLVQFVASNRKVRLARHESIPTYYRGLAATH
ncbi:hypothetical protein ABLE68_14535 [Nocardioides sp. CN2-186]|uniref:hypothetical protein n=1 Tax=Nocardioides tweenelious TaxID=3156607 RepID=UPI0032B37B81